MTHQVTLHKSADYEVQPWKNGQGTTTEISRAYGPGASGDFIWRLSIADITQDGPFSIFAGIDRTLMLLSGQGIELSFDPDEEPVKLEQAYSFHVFDGDQAVDCRLIDGLTRDFNVMTRQGLVRHEFEVLSDMNRQYRLENNGQTLLIFCLGKALTVMVSGTCYRLDHHDTIEINFSADAPVFLSPEVGAACAVIKMHPC
ncbi:MAG: histidine utilization protein HutD [Alphaproteobacteria bacterium]|nr:MAG: histidine utilization protein HutD [Alphaproteobacteria bacterium]